MPCCCPRRCHRTSCCSSPTWSPMDWLMQHWCHCWCCNGILACIALAVSPVLRCCLHHHCQPRMGICALVALDSSPALHPHCHKHCKLVSTPSRCDRDTSAYVASLLCSLSSSVVVVAPFPGNLALMSGQSCAGGFAGIAQASLPGLRWRPCKHCTVNAGIALALSPMLPWPLYPHCSGIASILAN